MPINKDTIIVDSLNAVIESRVASSLFQNHLLPVKSETSQVHATAYTYMLSGMLVLLFAVFVWLYVSNRKKLTQVVKAFYQTRFTNQNKLDDFFIGSRISLFLSIFFVCTITIFISQTIDYFGIELPATHNITLIISFIVVVIYGFKFLIITLLGAVFQLQKKAREYVTSIFLFFNVLGLIMLPLVTCLAFMKPVSPGVFIYTGLLTISFFLIIRMVRGAYIGLKSPKISKIYLFMYLCALEILPVILIVKLFR